MSDNHAARVGDDLIHTSVLADVVSVVAEGMAYAAIGMAVGAAIVAAAPAAGAGAAAGAAAAALPSSIEPRTWFDRTVAPSSATIADRKSVV